MPGWTSPSLRPEACNAKSASFSTSRISSFHLESSRAMEAPEMPPPMMRTSGFLPSRAVSRRVGMRIDCSPTSSQRISLTTWVVLYFSAAREQASITSSQVGSRPLRTMLPSENATVTAGPKRFSNRRFILRMFIFRHLLSMSAKRPTLYQNDNACRERCQEGK